MICGLLGEKLTHSYSPQIHNMLADYAYKLFEVSPDSLPAFFEKTDFHGINVTIPYKKAVIPFCDALSEQAEHVGAVNTILRTEDGRLIGHNSDYYGFSSMIKRLGIDVSEKKVLILGSGGACATVKAVLNGMNASTVVISRNGPNHYGNLELHRDCAVIVNTTPVGMYPNNGNSPIDLSIFPKLEAVIDLIYNPARTRLLQQADSMGIKTENGLWMLVAQAKESAEWFMNNTIPDSAMEPIYKSLYNAMQNIILIGMPGCGKTTLGKHLANSLNRPFYDTDICISDRIGCSCSAYIHEHGEAAFRKVESEVLSSVCKLSGAVIATGGGCVTVAENYPLLKQNGNIVWVKRDISLLDTADRPLSQLHGLQELYQKRQSMYVQFADAEIDNNTTTGDAVNQILCLL